MRHTVALIASLLTTLLLSACAGGLGSGDYERTQTRGVQEHLTNQWLDYLLTQHKVARV